MMSHVKPLGFLPGEAGVYPCCLWGFCVLHDSLWVIVNGSTLAMVG